MPKTIGFVTRCHPLRAKELAICKASIVKQTSQDYEHILIRDPSKKGCGRLEANRLFAKYKKSIPPDNRYLMVLDDDDMLVNDDFVKAFRKIVKKQSYDLIVFKGWHFHHGILPPPELWEKPVKFSKIASFCMAVEQSLWFKHIEKFGMKERGGDFEFMKAVYKNAKSIYWLDMEVARTQRESW